MGTTPHLSTIWLWLASCAQVPRSVQNSIMAAPPLRNTGIELPNSVSSGVGTAEGPASSIVCAAPMAASLVSAGAPSASRKSPP